MSGNNDADDSGVRFGSTFVFADTTGTTEDIYQDDIVWVINNRMFFFVVVDVWLKDLPLNTSFLREILSFTSSFANNKKTEKEWAGALGTQTRLPRFQPGKSESYDKRAREVSFKCYVCNLLQTEEKEKKFAD